jgi:O-antigen/teichoic acid export membrane protein
MLAAAKGGGILTAGRLFEMAGGFAIAFLLARMLGAEQYGLYALALQVAMVIAGISSLGLDSAMVRYVAVLNTKQDEAGIWGTLQIGVGGAVGTSAFMGAVMYFMAVPLAVDVFDEPQLVPLLHVLSVFVPCLTLSNVLVSIAHGFKRMDYSVIAQCFVQLLVRLTLVVILAMTGLNAFRVAVVFGVADIAASLTLLHLLNREFRLLRPLGTARRDVREIVAFSWPLWLSDLLRKFRRNIEIILLGTLSSVAHVGVFALVSRINHVGRVSYQSICSSVKPVFAELHTHQDWQQMGRLYKTTSRWTFMLNLPTFLFFVMYPGPILAVFGDSFTGGATALIILALSELVIAVTGTCGSIIDMTGYTRLKLVNSFVWSVLLISGNFLLIPRWGLVGAATATCVATSAVNLARLVEVWYLFRLNPYSKDLLKLVWCGLVAFGLTMTVGWWSSPQTNVVSLGLQAILLYTSYAGMLALVAIAPEDRMVLARLSARVRVLVDKPSAAFRRWLIAGQ